MGRPGLRLSPFTARIPDGDTTVWFQSRTGRSLRLAARHETFVERILAGDVPGMGDALSPGLMTLRDQGYLVDDDSPEYEDEHRRYLREREEGRILILTVAPTLACNLRCTYCFQQEIPPAQPMTPQLASGLVDFVRARTADRQVSTVVVQWFGGEPLLAFDLVRRCTRELVGVGAENGFSLQAEMFSNGLLLQRRDVWGDLPGLHLTKLNLTLDGLPETYARRKGIPLSQARHFYRFLLDRTPEILDAVGRMFVRINVDKENVAEAYQVVEMFLERGIRDRRLFFTLGCLDTSDEMTECIPHECLDSSEYVEHELAFLRHLVAGGLPAFRLPERLRWPCGAALRSYYAIDPLGRIGKCVPLLGTGHSVFARLPAFGAGGLPDEALEAPRPFGDFDPFTAPRCSGCPLLPACLGACPKRETKDAGPCARRELLEQRVLAFTP